MGRGRKEDYVRVTRSKGDLGRGKSHLKSRPIRGQGWEHVYPHICQSSIRASLEVGRNGEGGHRREIGLSGAQVKRAVPEKVWLAVESTPRVSTHCWPGLRGSPKAAAL